MSRCSRYFWILQDALDFLGFLLVIVYFDFRETVVYLPRGALTPPRFGGKFKIVNSALLARVKKIGMIQGSLNWTLQHSILSNSALGSCTVTLDWRFWPSTATFCSVLPTISRSGNTFWLAVLRIFCFSSPWSVIMSNVSVPWVLKSFFRKKILDSPTYELERPPSSPMRRAHMDSPAVLRSSWSKNDLQNEMIQPDTDRLNY